MMFLPLFATDDDDDNNGDGATDVDVDENGEGLACASTQKSDPSD
jgi:hypothetical protein